MRANPTLRSLAVLAILLAVLVGGVAIMRANVSRPVIVGGKMPTARVMWCTPASNVHHVSFSPSGRFICTVSSDNAVTCYSSAGIKRFSTVVPGADTAVVSSAGDCTLAYSALNRANRRLTFLDGAGRVVWQMSVAGAVWSADTTDWEDQANFVVGTGAGYIYSISIHGASKRYRRWRVPGAATSVAVDPTGSSVCSGTWQMAAVSKSDLTGHRDWQMSADPSCLHRVQTLADSDRLLLHSVPNRWGVDGEASLMESNGDVLSTFQLSASQRTRAMASPDGCFVLTGYVKAIRHSGKSVPEKHVALYDYAGRKLWDKGSLLFPTTPVLVTRGGFVLVAGSKNDILTISPAGVIKQACKLPAPVANAIASWDGSRALLFCGDGNIHFLRVSH